MNPRATRGEVNHMDRLIKNLLRLLFLVTIALITAAILRSMA